MPRKKFIVSDDDGNILRTGVCPAAVLELQAHGPNEYSHEGVASDIKDKIVNGKPTRRPQAEIDARTPKAAPVLAPADRPARITQAQWDALEARVVKLET